MIKKTNKKKMTPEEVKGMISMQSEPGEALVGGDGF